MANNRSSHRQAPPRYLGRSQQLRLLLLVMSLGGILLAIEAAAKPKNWYWLWGGAPATREEANKSDPAPLAAAPIAWLVDDPLREQLAKVEDDQPFRAGEHEVFYELLARLAEAGPSAINSAAVAEVSFVQLSAQPAEYRGKWVRFRGTVRQLKTIDASANGHGIERLHQLWIQHDDDPRSVSVVYCTGLPDGFPGAGRTDGVPTEFATAEDTTAKDAVTEDATTEIHDLRELVTITGIALKRWPYHAQDGMRTAPLVLTASPAWSPVAPAAGRGPVLPSVLTMGVTLVSAVVIALLIIRRGSRRSPPTPRSDEDTPETVIHGMKLADTSPNHVTAMRERDESAGGD